jgi:hypothetical protein
MLLIPFLIIHFRMLVLVHARALELLAYMLNHIAGLSRMIVSSLVFMD